MQSNYVSILHFWVLQFESREGSEESEGLWGIWRLDKIWMYIVGYIILDQVYAIAKWVSEYYYNTLKFSFVKIRKNSPKVLNQNTFP
jgi:hypothetical protein